MYALLYDIRRLGICVIAFISLLSPLHAQKGPHAWADYLNQGVEDLGRWENYLSQYNKVLVQAVDQGTDPDFTSLNTSPDPGLIHRAHQYRDSLYQAARRYSPSTGNFADWEEWRTQVYTVQVNIDEAAEALIRYQAVGAWKQDAGYQDAFRQLKNLGVYYADYAALQDRISFILGSWVSAGGSGGGRENPLWVPGHTLGRWMESGRELLRNVMASDQVTVRKTLASFKQELTDADNRKYLWVKALGEAEGLSANVYLALYEKAHRSALRLVTFGEEYLQAPANLPSYGESGKDCYYYNVRLVPVFSDELDGLVASYNQFRLAGNLPLVAGIAEPARFCPVIRAKQETPKPVVQAGKLPMDIVFVIDVSGSMGQPEKVPLFRRALAYWLAKFPEATRVSLVTFSGTSRVLAPLTPVANGAELLRKVQTLGPEGQSLPEEGLGMAYLEVEKAGDNKRAQQLVVITDGGFEIDAKLLQLIESNGYAGIPMHTFYFGSYPEQAERRLSRLAAVGQGRFLAVNAQNFEQALHFLISGGI